MEKLPTKDWTLKKVMQVEGERTKAQKSSKAIESFFKGRLLLGSRALVINTSKTKWALSNKGKRALIEGMSTQIVLNEKLICMDLDYTNVFGKYNSDKKDKSKFPYCYLLEVLMNMKALKPITVRGELKYCPLFHSCCPRSEEETTFYYPPHCKDEAENILSGFPLFLKEVLRVNPSKYCRSLFLQQVRGGKFDPKTRKFVSKINGPAILEFIQVDSTPNEESFLSSAENNAMAREEDDLTETTDLRKSDRNDEVSTITDNTDNTISLKAKNTAM